MRGRAACRSAEAITAHVAIAIAMTATQALGCPFCGVVGQSLAQRRDEAAAVAVGEAGAEVADVDGPPTQRFRIDQFLRAAAVAAVAGDTVTARVDGPVTGTAILFASGTPPVRWSAIAADESLLGYVAAAPGIVLPPAERLRWFAARLEHPDRGIATDAFTEFGLAPFADVRAAAMAVDPRSLQRWVADPGIEQRRRGLYGLMLGAVAADAADPVVAGECLASLRRAAETPGDDFRAGFDGVLAGLLVAEGRQALAYLRDRGLFGPDARPLDQRHLLAALRFAAESLSRSIPRGEIAAATARLLQRPAVAADAVIDLARYQAWDAVDDVAGLWETLGHDDPLMRRAVAGYLAACPLASAKRQLEAIGRRDPALLRQALDAAAMPGAAR